MKRLEFLKYIVLTIVGLLTAPLAFSKKQPTGYFKIYHHYIRGLAYYDYQTVAEKIKLNDEFILKREPQNHVDKYAVEVYFNTYKLGYLPRYENKVIANLMDLGIEVKAICKTEIPNKNDLYRGIFMHVEAQL